MSGFGAGPPCFRQVHSWVTVGTPLAIDAGGADMTTMVILGDETLFAQAGAVGLAAKAPVER